MASGSGGGVVNAGQGRGPASRLTRGTNGEESKTHSHARTHTHRQTEKAATSRTRVAARGSVDGERPSSVGHGRSSRVLGSSDGTQRIISECAYGYVERDFEDIECVFGCTARRRSGMRISDGDGAGSTGKPMRRCSGALPPFWVRIVFFCCAQYAAGIGESGISTSKYRVSHAGIASIVGIHKAGVHPSGMPTEGVIRVLA